MFNYVQFKYRRLLRRWRRNIKLISKWSVNYIDRHIWGKWHQLKVVRRFLIIWWAIIAVSLIGVMQQIGGFSKFAEILVADSGGTYTEAAIGSVRTLNPILPESTAASDISRLIFSGLTRYNSLRQVVPDLATWTVSADGKAYTFRLNKGVKWHDGRPLTSTDVAFTLDAIQNPDSRSPLASSWQGVSYEIKDEHTIVLKLPQPLSSFLDSTTVGLLPRHILGSIDPSVLREAQFNQSPIGTGPFSLKTFAPAANTIELKANANYLHGRPRLDEFHFKFYDTTELALAAFAARQVTSPGRISTQDAMSKYLSDDSLNLKNLTLPEEETLFFATGEKPLNNKDLRRILSAYLDRQQIVDRAAAGVGLPVTQPILPGQLGYSAKYAPTQLTTTEAKAQLEALGWALPRAADARVKDGQKLSFKLMTVAGGELEQVAKEISSQYANIGVKVTVVALARDELQQSFMRPRNFQMLLYGVNLGSDPDVYSFWHSSQIKDPGVNLSAYSSPDADRALETGRIRSDAQIRQGKYDAFLKAWNADAPAAVLYEQGYTYATRSSVGGIMARRLVSPADRFYGVERWTVRERFAR